MIIGIIKTIKKGQNSLWFQNKQYCVIRLIEKKDYTTNTANTNICQE